MPELDLRKRFAELYKPSAKVPSLVTVPPLRFLMVDGAGEIGEAAEGFQQRLQAVFSLAYSTKFEAKKRLGLTYPVMPLEGLYWDEAREVGDPWCQPEAPAWRLMIMLPDEVPGEFVDEVRAKVIAKKGLPYLDDVRVQTFSEGPSVQIMHVGPYSAEGPTIERLRAFAAEKGLAVTGRHHEIYMGDPRRSAPERLKTVLRVGVSRGR